MDFTKKAQCNVASNSNTANAAPLQECLTLQEFEGRLEAIDLSLSSSLTFRKSFWLSDAHLLKLLIIFQNCTKFCLQAVLVGGVLGDGLLEACSLFYFVFHILLLHGL